MRAGVKCLLFISISFVTSTTLIAQSLISIDPDNALQGENLGVGITGQDTHFDQAAEVSIWFSQGSSTIDAYGYYPVDDTFMTAWFDIPSDALPGPRDLNVYNNIDGTLTLYDGFTINPYYQPDLVSVNPDNTQQGQSLSVAITGQYTHFHQGTEFAQGSPTEVWFSQGSETVFARGSWPINDTLLIAEFNIPCDAATGLQDVSVWSDIDGTITLYDSFTITPYNPVLTSITPRGAYQGQSLSVTITGQNAQFQPGSPTANYFCQGSPTTWFGQGTPTTRNIAWFSQGSSTIFSSDCWVSEDTLLIANFDIPEDANAGFWDIHVPSVTDGTLTLTDGFMVIQPGDWTGDGMVNFFDVAVLADNWLEGTNE